MFIRKCMQTFMMDEKEVVLAIMVGREYSVTVYTIPIEIADELKLDEYEGSAVDSSTESGEELLERLEEFELKKEQGKKLPFVTMDELR